MSNIQIDIMTLFPEMCESFLSESIIGRAIKNRYLDIKCHQIRDFAHDKHKRVDDTPYGGGKGMVMKAEPIYLCFENICKMRKCRPKVVYMSPKGKVLTQNLAKKFKENSNLVILCGHYEGVHERILDEIEDEYDSNGD